MLVADQQMKSLGKLVYGKPFDFTYTLTNDSTEVIVIQGLTVGCGSCTKAFTSQTSIAPLGNTIINVTFTPGSTGKQSKNINVSYRQGKKQREILELRFTAEV